MGVSSVPGNSSDIRVSGIWIQGRTQAKDQQKLCCDRKKKNQRSGRLKMVWVITRRSRMVKSRAGLHGPHDAAGWSGFPDQFQIGAAESIRSAYTPLKPRTDGQPCHLSETTIYMQLTLLSGGWWWLQIKRSNDWRSYLRARLLAGRLFFESLTSSSRAFYHSGHGRQSMLFSFSVTSPGPWITLHTYISEHCDNSALSKFTKIIGHCLEQLWQQRVLFSMCEQLLKSEAV